MHPNITIIKPQLQDDIKRAFLQIPKLLQGEDVGKQAEKDYMNQPEVDYKKIQEESEIEWNI